MSVRESIVANILDTLTNMSEGTGYHYDWARWFRWRIPGTPTQLPAGALLDTGEAYELLTYDLHSRTLEVELHALHSIPFTDEHDPGEMTTWMIDDIMRALMQDVTRGGDAVDTRIVRSEKFVDEPAEPLAGVVVFVEVDYRTNRTDPDREN